MPRKSKTAHFSPVIATSPPKNASLFSNNSSCVVKNANLFSNNVSSVLKNASLFSNNVSSVLKNASLFSHNGSSDFKNGSSFSAAVIFDSVQQATRSPVNDF